MSVRFDGIEKVQFPGAEPRWQIDDGESERALVLMTDEAIELRDLLLKEFPLSPLLTPVTPEDLERERVEIQKERRERIATRMLAGVVNYDALWAETSNPRVVAGAIRWADALIAALDKVQP